jgi:type II secretory pathway pseudopilin PulG
VELLIVLVIIALLMALVLAGLGMARTRAQNASRTLEINQLAAGMASYKDARGAFPPSFAAYNTAAPFNNQNLIVRHLRNAFPQYNRDPDSDGVPGTYLDFADDVATGTSDFDTSRFASGLDVNTLDQAEALVFWLAGFPSIRTESKTIGFSLNPLNPFESDTVQPNAEQRTRRHFEFKPDRLVDEDNDGWWEYIPEGSHPTGDMAPFVYFDSASYNAWTAPTPTVLLASYPSSVGGALRGGASAAQANQQISMWGRCWPMWRVVRDPLPPTVATPPDPPAQWVNSDTFQIICAGEDGTYSLPDAPPDYPTVFPDLRDETGTELADPDDPHLDNLTNFCEGTLEDERDTHELQ